MVFSIARNFTIALLELCRARNKPDKVATFIQDTEELAQEEIDAILNHNSRCKSY